MAPEPLALPRELEADPGCTAIRARLATANRRLWPGGQVVVSLLPLGPAVEDALGRAYAGGRLVLGLEAAAAALATEARGLAQLAQRAGAAGARVSRLLLLSEDGAERLYRQAERLATVHAPRVLVVMLTAAAPALGRATIGRDVAVKAVLVRHKQAVASLLRALAT